MRGLSQHTPLTNTDAIIPSNRIAPRGAANAQGLTGKGLPMLTPDCSSSPEIGSLCDGWPHGYGMCHCGCGRETAIPTKSDPRWNRVVGVPMRYRQGHATGTVKAVPLVDRFWTKVDKSGGPDACWPWLAAIDTGGYGRVTGDGNGKWRAAHRVAWELTNGPIPEGLVIDHLCRNRACQNPKHLEPVPFAENVLRGVGPSAEHARQTHCHRGHEFTESNTMIESNGARRCRTCKAARQRACRLRNK